MGNCCSNTELSHDFVESILSKENFPKLRKMDFQSFNDSIKSKVSLLGMKVDIYEKPKWSSFVNESLIPNEANNDNNIQNDSENQININRNSDTQEDSFYRSNLLLCIYDISSYNIKATRPMLCLYLFSLLDHSGLDEDQRISIFYETMIRASNSLNGFGDITTNRLTFSMFNTLFVYYLNFNLNGLYKILQSGLGTIRNRYNFEDMENKFFNVLNIKKYYYSHVTPFSEELKIKSENREIKSYNKYIMSLSDFNRIFNGKNFIFDFEELNGDFIKFVNDLK